ncbi:small acid-soluble spore protein Tlp [Tepidibacter hydrothermalis]|uniref:Protein Tlp homolog n=1 Tax=Tepidibacter hydrothermalis TaxID=3036126 RepID=A0ABY8EH59_9FIRM|nr:small acid-soluble spore protein Tlp [Tepidibacter hydrothermalis]WFD12292.1 small acid-soluble spore protein Tlp [Tepidibacter hydrothermalis]
MKHNKDDRRDNVDRIQYNIDKTIQNFRMAEDMIEETSDDKMKKALEAKNDRREEALTGMRNEIKEEAIDKQNGYK